MPWVEHIGRMNWKHKDTRYLPVWVETVKSFWSTGFHFPRAKNNDKVHFYILHKRAAPVGGNLNSWLIN